MLGDFLMAKPPLTGEPNSNYLWTHRRRMAYVCLVADILITVAVIFAAFYDDDVTNRLKIFETFLTFIFVTFMSIPGAYIGLATYSDIKSNPIAQLGAKLGAKPRTTKTKTTVVEATAEETSVTENK